MYSLLSPQCLIISPMGHHPSLVQPICCRYQASIEKLTRRTALHTPFPDDVSLVLMESISPPDVLLLEEKPRKMASIL